MIPKQLEAPEFIITEWVSLTTDRGVWQVAGFQSTQCDGEHLALLNGPMKNDMLVRVHSECLTGDVFASQHCDCGSQLESTLELLQKKGGLLLYLRQEGRGIGLMNKMRAYALQSRGLDTIKANEHLNLPIDARDYRVAAAFLTNAGVSSVCLITNSPDKVSKLSAAGISISRVAALGKRTDGNAHYLDTKRKLLGHHLEH